MVKSRNLVAAATRGTGIATVTQLLEKGRVVRALAHRDDAHAERLPTVGHGGHPRLAELCGHEPVSDDQEERMTMIKRSIPVTGGTNLNFTPSATRTA